MDRSLHRFRAAAARTALQQRRLIWPILQSALAATVAWLISSELLGKANPFFAPVAAVVALNTVPGERGLQALRMLTGVVIGIVVGELALAAMGTNAVTVGIAVLVAMTLARQVVDRPVALAQAGVGAILTVVAADGEAGLGRLIDALVGGGVALVFSQLLFPPEPMRLVRRAEQDALERMAAGLEHAALALELGDAQHAEAAMQTMRSMRDRLAHLARMRTASVRVSRHSLTWRRQHVPLVSAVEQAGHLDLLGDACVMLTRALLDSHGTPGPESGRMAPLLRELAGVLGALARDPGDVATRRHAAQETLALARAVTAEQQRKHGLPTNFALALAQVAARDVLIFAGVNPAEAADAIATGGHQPVPAAPPEIPAPWFRPSRWPSRRRRER